MAEGAAKFPLPKARGRGSRQSSRSPAARVVEYLEYSDRDFLSPPTSNIYPSPSLLPTPNPPMAPDLSRDIGALFQSQEVLHQKSHDMNRKLDQIMQRLDGIESTMRVMHDVLLDVQRSVGVLRQGSVMRSAPAKSQNPGDIMGWGT